MIKTIPERLKPNKYGAKKTIYNGRIYDSKKEAKRAADLELMQKRLLISNLEYQVRLPINVCGVKVCDYIADFTYYNSDGDYVIEDVKGMKSGAAYQMFRLKAKLIKAIYQVEVTEI